MATSARSPRPTLTTSGTFTSVPAALDGVAEGLLHAFKMQFVPISTVTRDPGSTARQRFSVEGRSDRALIDLGSVDPTAVDLSVVARDCELLAEATREHPDVVRAAVEAVCGAGTGSAGISSAATGLSRIGLTEQGTRDQGGGIVALLVLVAAAVLVAGCETCQTPIAPDPGVPVSPGPMDAGVG